MLSAKFGNFLEKSLGRLVGCSHFSMTKIFTRKLQELGLDITIDQCRVLFTLFIEDGRKQQEISDALLQDKSSTSRLVQSLERKGYIMRKADLQDERQKRVFLTKEGLDVQNICLNCAYQAEKDIEEQFSEAEWGQLLISLQKLTDITRSSGYK